MTWKQILDRAHAPAQIDALAEDGPLLAERLQAELAPATKITELEARDAQIVAVLDAIDVACIRAMKVRLDYALANDGSIGAPTRNVFAQTIMSYANNLPLLAERARETAARGRSPVPGEVAELVVAAARSVLVLRDALTAPVFDLVRRLAVASVPEADRSARDPALSEAERTKWSAVRRDLEILATEPAVIRAASMPARVAAQPAQLDEAAPQREVSFADLIEID